MPMVHHAPHGLDYDPVTGAHSEMSFGILKATLPDGSSRKLLDPILRRLYPAIKAEERKKFAHPTAERHDVLLPARAPDYLRNVELLASAYHATAIDRIKDLAAIVTIQWPQVEDSAQHMTLHDAWESSRSFSRSICEDLQVAVIAIQHVPARSWGYGTPHVHLIIPARTVRPHTGFAIFKHQLTQEEEGRTYFDEAWGAWKQANQKEG